MPKIYLAIISGLILVLSACGKGETARDVSTTSQLTEAELLGTWEITDLNVTAPTYLGGDTTYVQQIAEAEWLQKYGVKPARTVFTDDGKLKRTYYLRNGQITDIVNGLWHLENDSLRIIEPDVIFYYRPTLNGEKLTLTGRIDYDRDGDTDDDYEATYRLVARTR